MLTRFHDGRIIATLAFSASVLAAGCGKKDQAERDGDAVAAAAQAKAEEVHRKRLENLREGLDQETFDLNQDGEIDQVYFRDGDVVARIERDMNFDGRTDLWQYPDAAGRVVEEEMDLDLDGTIDLVAFYEDGVVTRKEMSVNFDDQFTLVKFYNNKGKLLRVQRDKDGDGKTDIWEYYGANGQRQRVAWDENKDGEPDTFDTLN